MEPLRQQQLAMPTVEVFIEIEFQMLVNIAKQLRKHKTLLNEDDILSWQVEQLSAIGSLTRTQIITISKHSGLAIDEVSKALKTAGYEAVSEHEIDLEKAVLLGLLIAPPSIESSTALEAVLSAYQAQAVSTFNMIGTTMLSQARQAYLDIVNNTVGVVMSGAQTPYEALRSVATKWADQGVPALVDRAGKKWTTEAYVNMVMRSTVNNVANEMQDTRMAEYDVDLVEINSHMGARPKCAPYQGRIFSMSGTHSKYPAFSTTSYGDPAGLLGVNCRHVKYPFIEGVSKHTYKPYNAKENRENYLESQQQRKLERGIRKAKRELAMMTEMDDDTGVKEANKKVRERQAQMRSFIDETGRTRNRQREQIV